MPSTPAFLVVPFREELQDPMGAEFEQITDVINSNFGGQPFTPVSARYSEFTPEPLRSEIQSLVSQLSAAFDAVAASSVAPPVVLQNPEQIPEPYQFELLYLVSAANLGLAQLFP